jgi:hypothetical protein
MLYIVVPNNNIVTFCLKGQIEVVVHSKDYVIEQLFARKYDPNTKRWTTGSLKEILGYEPTFKVAK